MSHHCFVIKFLIEISINVILIFCLNFPPSNVFNNSFQPRALLLESLVLLNMLYYLYKMCMTELMKSITARVQII